MPHLSREELQDVRAAEQQRAIGGVGRPSGPDFSQGLKALASLIGFLAVGNRGLNARAPGILGIQKPPVASPTVPNAGKKQREMELRRRGRRSTILSGGAGVTGPTPLSQPQALGA